MTLAFSEVRYGDCFRVGPHLFRCGDLLAPGEWEGLVKEWRRRDKSARCWVYSDPPWSSGNLRYWRTHAGYEAVSQDYTRFIERFVQCVGMLSPVAVYVEQSAFDYQTLTLAASRNPAWPNLAGRWTVRYGARRKDGTFTPNALLRFASEPCGADPSEMRGEPMTRHVFAGEGAALKGLPVVDPCVGLGTTVRVAHSAGLACLGNELNPKRLARTIDWLARRGLEVERL